MFGSLFKKKSSIVEDFNIPEPTRSLLWITNEDTSKISSVHQIKIEINISEGKVESNAVDESYKFYSEPSLIWTKLSIEPNRELETEKMYYPSYTGLSPKHRYQYLKWLTDITQETNLSYVFLYYYGLERHLLLGNYDAAIQEILRLVEAHGKTRFPSYAKNGLVIGSMHRKRPDILEKAPFVLEDGSELSLLLLRVSNKPITAKIIMNIAPHISYHYKKIINKNPELFEDILQSKLELIQNEKGDILQNVDITKLPKNVFNGLLNISVPDPIRNFPHPAITDDREFRDTIKFLLQQTQFEIRNRQKELVS